MVWIMRNFKVKTREELSCLCRQWQQSGKTIGFTSGAFDILHAGHVDYLEKAKSGCDILIVGINTDASIQRYKGPDRPIIQEQYRVQVVAALEVVDYVFLFSERRNGQNIEALRPDFYIKAGDYSAQTLTSTEIVEKFGGEVRIIPVSVNLSTTKILEKAAGGTTAESDFVEAEGAGHFDIKPSKQTPAVFLDRDGTINVEKLYLHEPDRFELLPNAVEGIRKFQDMGYRIVVITNQPGIGMGYYSKEDFYAVNREMLKQLSAAGILVDKIYFCPHSKSDLCECRKPGLALVRRAEADLNLDLSRSVFIGDKSSDVEAGKRAGMFSIQVRTGLGEEEGGHINAPDAVADDILEAARIVLERERTE